MEAPVLTGRERGDLVLALCKERGISVIQEPGKVTLIGDGVYIVATDLRYVHPRDLRKD